MWLARQLFCNWQRIAASLALAGIGGALSTLDPLLLRHLIDVALPGRQIAACVALIGGIVACIFGRTLFLLLSLRIDFGVDQDLGQNLRIQLIEHMTRLSASYHESTPAGDKMVRLQSDVDQVAQLGADIASSITRATVFLGLNAIVMLRINGAMTLALLPAVILFVWIQPRFVRALGQRADNAQQETGRASSVLTEYVSALPQLQLLGAERAILKNAIAVWTGMIRARKDQRNVECLYASAIECGFVLSALLILGVGGSQYLRGALTIGGLVAFYTYSTRIFDPLSSLLDTVTRLQRVGASIRRVQAVLSADEIVPDFGTITMARSTIAQGISMDQVTYSYNPDYVALNNVSFHIRDGERVGIVGPSGSGKSTLVRLLVRLADPQAGAITLGGYPIREYSLSALRSTICYVPQTPILFQGTVAENLRYANPSATDADLKRAIAAARLTQTIQMLPNGINSLLGPFGHGLSGGEQQRLAVARALLRSAPVLILDESTSALDLATERAVLKSIAEYGNHSILIIISHRLASLTWVDQLVVLSAGKVETCGNHASLYSGSAFYRSLYDANRSAPLVC